MLTLRQHDANDYAALPDIDLPGVGDLTQDDWKCLDELGDRLVFMGAHERFGATLLHSHFAIDTGETFVEDVDITERQIRLRPVSGASAELAAVNVRFDEPDADSDDIRLIGLEFAADDILGPIAPISQSDNEVLSTVREILFRHGKGGRFGLRLFHDPLKIDDTELLAETCDPVRRVLSCKVAKADAPGHARSIPTVFRWKRLDPDGVTVMQSCAKCTYRQICTADYGGKHTSHDTHDQKTGHD